MSRAEIVNFDELQFTIIFSCMVTFWKLSKNLFETKVSKMFSNYLLFKFRSMVHIKISFVWYDIGVKIHPPEPSYGYPVVPGSFVGKSFLSSWNYTGAFIKCQLVIYVWIYSRPFCYWFICLITCKYHIEMTTVNIIAIFEIRRCRCNNIVYLLHTCTGYSRSFIFPYKFLNSFIEI